MNYKKLRKKSKNLGKNQILRTLNEVPKFKISMFRASKQQKKLFHIQYKKLK